tara:strand:+ start:747 stop:1409 length:663 start_codon:yes stop_codon:yes gene_type:complete
MIKQISFFKRRPDLDVQAFQQHWRTQHAALVGQIPGIIRYVQNHVESIGSDEPLYDGIAEVWFESMDEVRNSAGSSHLKSVREDETNFIDADSMGTLLTDEHVVVDGQIPDTAIKLVIFVPKLVSVSPEIFQTTYLVQIGPMVKENPHILRYVQAHCRPGFYRSGRVPPYDAISVLWFNDAAAQQEAFGHESLKDAPAMEATIMDHSGIKFLVVKEHQIL